MNIYIYTNIIGNSCSGEYYFVAEDKPTSYQMARHFSDQHNKIVNNNQNYIIEWDEENVKEFEVVPGLLPLNRTMLYMEK